MSMLKVLIAVSISSSVFAQGVDVVRVVSRSAERKVQLPGEFIPFQTVTIHAKVTGFVDRIEVDRGSVVKKGQLLATLDAPELRAQRAEAEAKVLNAESQRAEAEAKLAGVQSTYERLKAASATPGVIAGNELIQAEKIVDAARAQVRAVEGSIKAAQASVQVVRDMEDYLQVTAPFDGGDHRADGSPRRSGRARRRGGGNVPTGPDHAVTPDRGGSGNRCGWHRQRIQSCFHGTGVSGTDIYRHRVQNLSYRGPQDPSHGR
jgi:hypothetical protein